MTNSEESKIMDSILDSIRMEQPKIDVSIKNFLSVLIAKSQKDNVSGNPVDSLPTLSPHFLMDYAKLFLSCLQQAQPVEYSEYFALNPQSEGQSASARLDEMCTYKAYVAYRQHVVQSGQKVSKHFGKSYFIVSKVWPQLKSNFLKRLEDGENKRLTVGEGQHFIDLYENSIFSSDDKSSDSELIWARNFQEVLKQRHVERVEVATKRANEAMADAMRQAMEDVQQGSNSEEFDKEETF